MDEFSTLSVVVPAINETDSLRENVEIVLATCDHKELEEIFIVVCERTTSECLAVIKNLMEWGGDVPIRLYYQKEPGIASAVHEAIEAAAGSHAVNIAADLDTDAYAVKNMIEAAKENPDAIILASRWIKGGGFVGYGRLYVFLNYLFQKMLQILFFTKATDLTYGFRLASVDKLLSVTWESKGFSGGTETNLKMVRMGYKIVEVPAVWRAREQGVSQNSFLIRLKYVLTVFKVRFEKMDSIVNNRCRKKPD